MINRRMFAVLAGAAVLMPGATLAQRAGGVRVDLSPLQRAGLGGESLAVIDRALRRELGAALASRGGGITVRIDSISLTGFAGGGALERSGRWFGMGGGGTDYMAGEVIRTDAQGRVVTRFPMHNALAPSGAWYDPAIDLRRLDALATHWAQWAVRQAG